MSHGLRRDLGRLESYAAMVGILVGAGIFRVTGDAFVHTGPSVILGYLVLAPAVLATSIAYVVFASTPLGSEPGGEYTHIARTFGGTRVAFVGAWLKLISYIGAAAYLAGTLAEYLCELASIAGVPWIDADSHGKLLACGALAFFYVVHATGVRWFGKLQVAMCAVLALSILVLVVPGLFALDLRNYRPFFTGGMSGFAAALPPLFFAYAGFEVLAHAGGEVRDSRRELPRVFVWGILVTTLIFLSMSVVAFGVRPGSQLIGSGAPMAVVGEAFLPGYAAALVALGGIMAVATSVNATLLVPGRLGIMLARDGLLPRWCGRIDPRTATPFLGLTATFLLAAILVVTGMIALALTIAVFSLVVQYALHSLALLLLPRLNPELFAQVTVPIPLAVQRGAAWFSLAAMGTLIAVQVTGDVAVISRGGFAARWAEDGPTTLELFVAWGLLGAALRARMEPGQ